MARILIIDDDEPMRRVFRQLLSGEGHTLTVKCDGEEGLKHIREHGADLVITDLVMSNKDGLEVIDTLNKDFPNLPIIAISGGICEKSALALAIARGANATLSKPFATEGLLSTIKNLLEK